MLFLMSGASESGKSYLTRYLLINLLLDGRFDFGVVWCSTKFNDSYNFLTNQDMVRDKFSTEELLKFKQYIIDNAKPPRGRRKREFPKTFIVLDDLVGKIKWDSEMLNFLTTFRHYNVTVFLITQYLYLVPPIVRIQSNYTVLFDVNTGRDIDAAFESFGSKFFKKKDFVNMMNAVHGECEYNALVVMKSGKTIEERYGSYRAGEIPSVSIEF